LKIRDEILVAADKVSAVAPGSLQAGYEAATENLDEVGALAAEQLSAVEMTVDAKDAVDADATLLEAVGLIGEDLDQDLGEAVAAFEADSLDESIAQSQQVLAILAAAGMEGRNRVLIGLAIVIVLIAAVWLLLRRRRRRQVLLPGRP
jgi:hypothetical protein